MLDECAPGSMPQPKLHHYWVTYRGKTFTSLPKGGHGKTDPEIEDGHIRKMVRFLGIDRDCVARVLGIVVKPESAPQP